MFQVFALVNSCHFRPATCKCLEILKTSSEQDWNGGLKGRPGDFPKGRGCSSLETMNLVFLQIRAPSPLPISKSILTPRKVTLYRFNVPEKWDFPNQILIDTFCLSVIFEEFSLNKMEQRKHLYQNIICFCIEMVPRLHIARASNF